MSAVDWQPWRTAAFLDAQRRRRPVLLLLEVAWATACREAQARVFSRPDVVAAISEATVPVRVDAEWRPDIADRYGLGHWPSLLLLTPEGHLITGGTRPDETLATRVRTASAAYAAARVDGAPRVIDLSSCDESTGENPEARSDATVDAWRSRLAAEVWNARDRVTGAFLTAGVPSAAATLAALARAATTDDPAWAEAASATLTLIVGPDLRSATEALLGAPGDLLRLETLADWIHVLARASALMPDAAGASRLDELVALLRRDFRGSDGHWHPWGGADRLVLVDSAARACRALLAAAEARGRADQAREAVESLEILALASYQRGAGVAHVLHHGTARGPVLLDDAMQLAHALLDAEVWRGDGVYRDLADELRQTTRVRLQDHCGALQDRRAALAGAGQVGRLADPSYPLSGNGLAILLQRRLAAADDEARRMLLGIAPMALGAGLFAAPALLAAEALVPAGDVVAAW